ncbi:hypothetical protein IWQ62_000119 [Dispira parvispora]|uniref:Uncharacterized protein n=1 Tax=Dispira parvispora TaxID=1520584 RepID=A0A9W8B0T6_9FUNG|nr:hypothetical protein IWQ62_000119 [Dispira parvispora]
MAARVSDMVELPSRNSATPENSSVPPSSPQAKPKPPELAKFHKLCTEEQHKNASKPVFPEIPQSCATLFAALVQEKEHDLTIVAKYIQHILFPTGYGSDDVNPDDVVSLVAIEKLVQQLAEYKNYGIPPEGTGKPYAAGPLTFYRWEVKDLEQYFPTALSTVLLARRQAREMAARQLQQYVANLKEEERCSLMQPFSHRRSKKRLFEELISESALTAASATVSRKTIPTKMPASHSEPTGAQNMAESKTGETALQQSDDTLGTDDDQATKRARADKDQPPNQTKLQGFFTKIQRHDSHTVLGSNPVHRSDYDRMFRRFYTRPSTTVAPINPHHRPCHPMLDDYILHSNSSLTLTDPKSHLRSCFDPLLIRQRMARYAQSRLRVCAPENLVESRPITLTVTNDGWSESVPVVPDASYTEDSSHRDASSPKINGSSIRHKIFKLLQFSENIRPAYYGTWSRSSAIINGRRYLNRDTGLLDYDVDSEAEWELDEEGEDLASDDDGELDGEDELVEGGEWDSRVDGRTTGLDDEDESGWLVPEGYLSDDEVMSEAEDGESMGCRPSGTVRGESGMGTGPGKTVVQPLMPVIVGPLFGEKGPVGLPSSLRWISELSVRPFCTEQWPLKPCTTPGPTTKTNKSTSKKSTAMGSQAPGPGPSSDFTRGTSTENKVIETTTLSSDPKPPSTPHRRKASWQMTDRLTLAKIIHDSAENLPTLIDRTQKQLPAFSKRDIEHTIKSIAYKEKRTGIPVKKWVVKDPVLLAQLPINSASSGALPSGDASSQTESRADSVIAETNKTTGPVQTTLQNRFKALRNSSSTPSSPKLSKRRRSELNTGEAEEEEVSRDAKRTTLAPSMSP